MNDLHRYCIVDRAARSLFTGDTFGISYRELDAHVAIARDCRDAGEARQQRIAQRLREYVLGRLRAHGCRLPGAQIESLLTMDLDLNAQGTEVWLSRQEAAWRRAVPG